MANTSTLTLNTSVKTFNIGEEEVKVLQYLPIEQKNELIYLAIQNAMENGQVNLLKLNMFFNLYLAYSYTDIEFTDEEKEAASALYDLLQSSGVIDTIIANMDEGEYSYLVTVMNETVANKQKYNSTIAALIRSFIEELPINAENAAEIIKNFNPEQFTQVMNFVQAANGGRPL